MTRIQVNKVPALHGWQWVRRGFSLLGLAPMQLLLLVLVLKTITNLLPALGLPGLAVAKIIMPALIVGYLSVVRQLAPASTEARPLPPAGTPPDAPSRFGLEAFIGWARHGKALQTVLLIGALGLAIDFAALYLSGFQGAIEQLAIGTQQAGSVPTDERALAQLLAPVLQSLLLFLAITLPCYLFLWYAPIFAGLHAQPLMKSIVFSIVAVWRNLSAFFCYALGLGGLMLAAAVLSQLLGGLLGGGSGAFGMQSMVMFLMLPVLLALIGCSQWACYLDTITVEERDDTPRLPTSEIEG